MCIRVDHATLKIGYEEGGPPLEMRQLFLKALLVVGTCSVDHVVQDSWILMSLIFMLF